MCSRFHLSLYGKKILQEFPGYRDFKEGDFHPGDSSPILTGESGHLILSFMYWGFHPDGRKDNIFNARAESAEEKPMFKDSLVSRRCAVPASWFYEWNHNKEKMKFEGPEQDGLLYFAGFWRREQDGEHFVVLTTEANASMKSTHDRMPLILSREELSGWVGSSKQRSSQSASEAVLSETVRAALKKIPASLRKTADYEQLSLFQMGLGEE